MYTKIKRGKLPEPTKAAKYLTLNVASDKGVY